MEVNKDKGTSVGFSKIEDFKAYPDPYNVDFMQVLCKDGEHEYGEVTWTTSGTNCDTEYYSEIRCLKCGQKPIKPVCVHKWIDKVMGDIDTGQILKYRQCLKCGGHKPIETQVEIPELFEKDKEDEIWEDVLFRSMAFEYAEQKRCIAHLKEKFEIRRK